MNARALSLALRLLTGACAGVALATMTGCPLLFGCGDTGWQAPEARATMTTSDLLAYTGLNDYEDDVAWDYLLVGAGGTVVVLGTSFDESSASNFVNVYQVGTQTLRGALQDGAGDNADWWVVGDAGLAAFSSDRGQNWSNILLQTAANLRAIVRFGGELVIIGDGVVFMRANDGTWAELEAPSGSWGQLRAAVVAGDRLYVVGLAGAAWSTADPGGAWTAEELETDADLLGIGSDDDRVVAVGAGGTVIERSGEGTWAPIDAGLSDDLLDWSEGAILLDDGRVIELADDGTTREFGQFPGARSFQFSAGSALTLVGDEGLFTTQLYYECVGGRPFGSRDRPAQTAALDPSPLDRRAWLDPAIASRAPATPELAALGPETREALAAAWTRDALFEHASVASFARFAAELLALGAPAQLVAEAHAAAGDELRHAAQCFALAARFAAAPPCPAGLALPEDLWARSGDPVATALALFDEGCVNESVAACAAADAAAGCEDPPARAVLEAIARDEARHATLAWAALRWLLDRYGEPVAAALRPRLAGLRGSSPPAPASDRDDIAATLGPWGRLSAARQAEVEGRVITELVAPLAARMLATPAARHGSCVT